VAERAEAARVRARNRRRRASSVAENAPLLSVDDAACANHRQKQADAACAQNRWVGGSEDLPLHRVCVLYPQHKAALSTLKLIEDGVRVPRLSRNRCQGSRVERKSLRKIFGLK
jgi:hypothetical protein